VNEQELVDGFHELYYMQAARTWDGPTQYRGHKILKCPLDLWIYHEIIQEMKPDLVVECGTAHGASALWFADQLDLVNGGEVITIDCELPKFFPTRPQDARIHYVQGSSVDKPIVEQIHQRAQGKRTLVVLDSDHCKDHVRNELDAYADLTPVGGWLIVEDTNVHGHPVLPAHAPGPMEAILEWLPAHPEFQVDQS
jgi:cephalosporin hydroxylase